MDKRINGLDLFSGIGGLSYALSSYVKPIAYCEKDPFCQGVLLSRIARGDLANAPICTDILKMDGKEFCNSIDIIYGGFPCQDVSIAGKRKGLEGERTGLFFEFLRLAKELRPPFLFLENVKGIVSNGAEKIVREISKMGYDCRWCVVSAQQFGALHKRERWFMLAHSQYTRSHGSKECTSTTKSFRNHKKGQQSSRKLEGMGTSAHVADPKSKPPGRFPMRKKETQPIPRMYGEYFSINDWQKTVLEMDKFADGVSDRVVRFRALGNAVVPVQAKKAFEILMGILI